MNSSSTITNEMKDKKIKKTYAKKKERKKPATVRIIQSNTSKMVMLRKDQTRDSERLVMKNSGLRHKNTPSSHANKGPQ